MNWDGRQSIFNHLGKQMHEKDAAENTELVWEIIESAMKYSNEESAAIPAERSLYDYFKEKVQTMIPAEMEGDLDASKRRETILQMAEMWGAFVGSPIQSQSLKYFWMEECIDGENLFVAGTYHKVLQRIAEPALKGADVRFGHRVKRVVSTGTEEGPRTEVELDGEDGLVFDEVVMTAPLGWLKRNHDAFVPELPGRLKQAVTSIGYGNLDKVPTDLTKTSSRLLTSSGLPHLPNSFLERLPHNQYFGPAHPQPIDP